MTVGLYMQMAQVVPNSWLNPVQDKRSTFFRFSEAVVMEQTFWSSTGYVAINYVTECEGYCEHIGKRIANGLSFIISTNDGLLIQQAVQ